MDLEFISLIKRLLYSKIGSLTGSFHVGGPMCLKKIPLQLKMDGTYPKSLIDEGRWMLTRSWWYSLTIRQFNHSIISSIAHHLDDQVQVCFSHLFNFPF